MKIVFFRAKKRQAEPSSLRAAAVAFCVCLISLFALHFAFGFPAAAAASERKLPIYSVATSEKKISISFDCAWGVEHTDKILDELDRHNVRCTFSPSNFGWKSTPNTPKKSWNGGTSLARTAKRIRI